MEVITLLKSERKNSLIIKENIVYLLQKLTLIKNFQTCPFEAPLTNLFELFELLDRYQSEMIDFFTKNKSDKFGFISYDDMKKIELKLNV